jgi:hypothetical protein
MRMNELEHSSKDPPEPETGDEKEVYEFYGLASYNAQVAERGLMQLALLLRLQRISNATRAIYDQEYEALARRSFGQILTELARDQTLANDLRALLQKALGLRNHLTHHFFWDFAEEWFSHDGRLLMIQKLREATALFSEVGDKVGRVVDDLGENLGIGHDTVLRMYERLLNESQRKYTSA